MLCKKIGLGLILMTSLGSYGQQVAKAVNVNLVSSPGTKIVINGGITFTGSSNWKDSGDVFLQKNTLGGSGSENWLDSTGGTGVYDISSNGSVHFMSDSMQYIFGNTKFYNLQCHSDTGVYLYSNIEVRNQLNLDTGLLYTAPGVLMYVSNPATTSIQSTCNYLRSWVHGRLERAANVNAGIYLFPVGKLKSPDSLYAPVKLTKVTAASARYQVEYFPTQPFDHLNFLYPPIDHISDVENWEIQSNIPSGPDDDAKVSLSWRGYSKVSPLAARRDSLLVAQYINVVPFQWNIPGGWASGNAAGADSLFGYVSSTSSIASFIFSERRFTLGTYSRFNELPVKIIYFTANPDNNRVRLNWDVQQEQDINIYEIEKSLNGTSFSRMSTVLSLQKPAWLYTDYDFNPATGWNYYRLKSISKTGKITYSDIRKVKFDKGLELVKMFPNPATDVLNIQLPSSYVNNVSLQLYSIDGKFISTTRPASSTVQLNVSPLAAGNYLLKLVKEGNTESYTFIKQ